MNLFFIRIPEDLAADFSWLHSHAGETGQVMHGSFEAAAEAATGHQVVLLVPGEQVTVRNIDIPLRRGNKLLKAIPFALEEDMATDIDDLHFAMGHQENGVTPVAVVEKRLIEGWIGLCKAHNIKPRAIIEDTLSLPLEDASWSILLDQHQAIVRSGKYSGFNCHPAMLDALLNARIEEDSAERPDSIHVWMCDSNQSEFSIDLDEIEMIPHSCTDETLSILAKGWTIKDHIDLQQGEYGQSHDIGIKLRPWKWAAIIAGLLITTSFVKMTIEKNQLQSEKTVLATHIKKTYLKTFPKAKVKNHQIMRKQMAAELKKSGDGTGSSMNALALLDISSQTISNSNNIKLENINFNENLLELSVSASSLSQLDELKKKIAQATGLNTELKNANSSNNKTTGKIRIVSR